MWRGRGPRGHDEAVDRNTFLVAHGDIGDRHHREGGVGQRMADVWLGMGIAQCRQKLHAVAGMRLDRESKKAVGRENARRRRYDRREIVYVDKNVGSEDEIIFRVIARLGCKEVGEIGGGETVIEVFALCLRDHAGRKIDADQSLDKRTKNGTGKSGTAAEIEHGGKMQRAPGRPHRAFNGVVEQCRSAIAEALGERRVITNGILIEKPADIRFAHRRGGIAAPQPGKLQAGAVIVLRIGMAGFVERVDGARAVAEAVADGAERKPCGRKAGCLFHGLHKNVRRAGKIAARGMVESPFVAAVCDQIAGRNEKRAGVGHRVLAPRRGMIIYHSPCVLKTS